jgi:DNA-binding NarL/FixJ family response regulator
VGLVVLDLDMPDLDGEQTFHELRRIDPAAQVVFLTGLCDDARRARLLDAGARALLTKPCDSDVIRQAVAEAFGGRSRNRTTSPG